LGSNYGVWMSLRGLACLEAERGFAERGARLLGAEEMMRVSTGIGSSRNHQGPIEHALGVLRATLPADTLAAAWAEGRSMTLDEAVAYAVSPDSAAPTDVSSLADGHEAPS